MLPPEPTDASSRQRLARIQRLWDELHVARKDSPEYQALIDRIRQETDAFRRALDTDDPQKS